MHPFLLKEGDSWIKSTMLKLYFQIIKYVGFFSGGSHCACQQEVYIVSKKSPQKTLKEESEEGKTSFQITDISCCLNVLMHTLNII